MNRILNWIGYQLLLHVDYRISCNPNTRFGCWCLERAGAHAYADHDFGAVEGQ